MIKVKGVETINRDVMVDIYPEAIFDALYKMFNIPKRTLDIFEMNIKLSERQECAFNDIKELEKLYKEMGSYDESN